MGAAAKRFDYLPKFGAKIEVSLNLENLEGKINHWRNNGADDPDAVTVGCRKIIETSLRSMLELAPDERANLCELIQASEDEDVIPHPIALKCNEIRVKGNNAAHAISRTIDAMMALELLDDFLRWHVSMNFDEHACDQTAEGFEDGVFTPCSSDASSTLAQRASNAAALSDDKAIVKAASEAAAFEKKENKKFQDRLFELKELCEQAESLSASIENDDAPSLLDSCETILAASKRKAHKAETEIKQVSDFVDEILSEHDFIRRLLGDAFKATDEQFGVMAFPKGNYTKTNVLKLKGPAGSGKTLCLLAKLIKQTSQKSLFPSSGAQPCAPQALFVCYNKPLKEHVQQLLADFDGETGSIEIVSFDAFINQLIKPRNINIEWAKRFANDVRFTHGTLHYETAGNGFSLTKQAMDAVSIRHADRKESYYLDSSKKENLEWVSDEIRYLEVVYEHPGAPGTKRYIDMAPRTGRGGTHIPNAEIRTIIVEVWQEYYRILEAKGKYTLSQALYRLYRSNQLPKFKAIAIDESQDLSLIAVKVLFRMLEKSNDAYLYIAGDEDQKIYKNDFSWKQLDNNASGYTISLRENKRNSPAIESFANRLIGGPQAPLPPDPRIYIGLFNREKIGKISQRCKQSGESIAIITDYKTDLASVDGVDPNDIINTLSPKGLEFDNVIVVYDKDACDTLDEERRLRYVHFSRARKRLYISCPRNAPELMKKYYPDLLPE